MGALLEIREPDAEPRQFLAEDGMTFGRSPQNHCVLADPTVGTHHFRIVSAQSRLEIEDLGSRNSTEIGGAGFLKKGERRELVPGLIFRAGKTVFSVKDVQGAPSAGGVDAECRVTAMANSFRSLVAEADAKVEAAPAQESGVPSEASPPSGAAADGNQSDLRERRASGGKTPSVEKPSPPPADVRAAFERLRPRLVVACRGLQQIADLREPAITIGRGESADVRINHPHVAREHARIDFDGREFTIEPLGGERETKVDGDALAPGTRRVISSDTAIVFGSVDALFVIEERGAESTLHRRAAKILLGEKKVSPLDYREAIRQAETEGRHVGEVLLRDSDLCVSDWCDAFGRAARGEGGARRPLLVPLLVAALAVIGLLVYLFLFVF